MKAALVRFPEPDKKKLCESEKSDPLIAVKNAKDEAATTLEN